MKDSQPSTFSILLSIIATAITWLITSLILLVYSFTYLNEINREIFGFLDLKMLILALTTIFAIGSIWITGILIDRNPGRLHKLFIISLIVIIICLIFLSLINDYFIIASAFILLGLGLGLASGTAGAYFGGFSPIRHRGKVYSFGIFLFTGLAFVIIYLQTNLGQVEENSFSFMLLAF
ncbi:MAG: MFS transporter, partial [Candidatus Hodarchaeales archaeon]